MRGTFISYLLESMPVDPEAGPARPSPEGDNPPDAITLGVPLLIRLMEYAKEDAADDMALHSVAERLTQLAGEGRTLSMEDYDSIVGGDTPEQDPREQQDPRGEVDPMSQENEERAASRKAANKAVAVAKLKKDYADKMRWSAEEKRTTGRDRSGHMAGALKIKAHLKSQYGVEV